MFWIMAGVTGILALINVALWYLVFYFRDQAHYWQYRYENELDFIQQHFMPETD